MGYNGLINFECSFVAEECVLVLKPQPKIPNVLPFKKKKNFKTRTVTTLKELLLEFSHPLVLLFFDDY